MYKQNCQEYSQHNQDCAFCSSWKSEIKHRCPYLWNDAQLKKTHELYKAVSSQVHEQIAKHWSICRNLQQFSFPLKKFKLCVFLQMESNMNLWSCLLLPLRPHSRETAATSSTMKRQRFSMNPPSLSVLSLILLKHLLTKKWKPEEKDHWSKKKAYQEEQWGRSKRGTQCSVKTTFRLITTSCVPQAVRVGFLTIT